VKCFKHNPTEAVAVCAHCGRALCPDCIHERDAARLACSPACAEALNRADAVVSQLSAINQQLRRNSQASAFYCYLCAGLSAGAAVVAWFMLPSPFLILFTAGCAVVLVLSGIWHDRAARKHLA
jgi:hypothetical protein